MEKKWVLFLFLSICLLLMQWQPQAIANNPEDEPIPQQSIRLRILANSNDGHDQMVKRDVRDRVNHAVREWVGTYDELDEARRTIKAHTSDIETIVHDTLEENGVDQSYHVELRRTVFPTKTYGDYVYPAGEYEALVITLGEGEGANWWCVLFPPLCFIDMDQEGTATDQPHDSEDVTVKLFIVEKLLNVFEKVFS